jgi:hypothetical protein
VKRLVAIAVVVIAWSLSAGLSKSAADYSIKCTDSQTNTSYTIRCTSIFNGEISTYTITCRTTSAPGSYEMTCTDSRTSNTAARHPAGGTPNKPATKPDLECPSDSDDREVLEDVAAAVLLYEQSGLSESTLQHLEDAAASAVDADFADDHLMQALTAMDEALAKFNNDGSVNNRLVLTKAVQKVAEERARYPSTCPAP